MRITKARMSQGAADERGGRVFEHVAAGQARVGGAGVGRGLGARKRLSRSSSTALLLRLIVQWTMYSPSRLAKAQIALRKPRVVRGIGSMGAPFVPSQASKRFGPPAPARRRGRDRQIWSLWKPSGSTVVCSCSSSATILSIIITPSPG